MKEAVSQEREREREPLGRPCFISTATSHCSSSEGWTQPSSSDDESGRLMTSRFDTVKQLQNVLVSSTERRADQSSGSSSSRSQGAEDRHPQAGRRAGSRKPTRRPGLHNLFSTTSSTPERLQDWVKLGREEAGAGAPSTLDGRSSLRTTNCLGSDSSASDALDAATDRLFHQAGTTSVPHVAQSSLGGGSSSSQQQQQPSAPVPVLVFTPCTLGPVPKPADVLSRLSYRLEPYVQSDYVAVVFATPQPPNLPSSLLVSTYLTLSRPARKNIQRLLVVHPGFWSKMLVRPSLRCGGPIEIT